MLTFSNIDFFKLYSIYFVLISISLIYGLSKLKLTVCHNFPNKSFCDSSSKPQLDHDSDDCSNDDVNDNDFQNVKI